MHSDIFSISASFGGGSSCKTDECQRTATIVASVLGGICGVLLLIFCTILCCKSCKCCKGRPFRTNTDFVNMKNWKLLKQNAYDVNAFQSGIWSSRYFQYKSWHGAYQLSLSFDSQLMKVTGSGSDDVGTFTVDGIYSIKTGRIGLTKTYQAGTGNPLENLGHEVTIQLTWNRQKNQFEGKWYVQTSKYHGENKFELKLYKQQQFSVYDRV